MTKTLHLLLLHPPKPDEGKAGHENGLAVELLDLPTSSDEFLKESYAVQIIGDSDSSYDSES